jgi:hypothetical protein
MIPELDRHKKYYCLVPEQYVKDAEFLERLQEAFFRQAHKYNFSRRDYVTESLAFFVARGILSFWGVDFTLQRGGAYKKGIEGVEIYARDYGYEEFDLILEPPKVIDWSNIQ